MAVDTKRLAKIMKALSSEHRLTLYLEIAQAQETNYENDGCVVANIMNVLKLSPPTISHHLKELTNAELIQTERRGKFLVARVNKEILDEVEQVLSIVRGG